MPECSSCGAPIRWAKTIKGVGIPLDPEPSPRGNVVISEEGAALVYNSPGAVAARYEGEPRYLSHFATCPNADQHRKR
jgi:hypothetical protein